MTRFEGASIVVTGGSRGIGLAIGERFAREGATVLLCANEQRVHEAAAGLRDQGLNASGFLVDVTDAESVKSAYAQAAATTGKIDVSVQGAGVITINDLEKLSEKEWDLVVDVNCKGTFLCCQAAVAHMRGRGRLINIASGQARQGFIYTPHYAASKFGVIGITQSVAKEVAERGITVNAICPGIIETDMWAYNDEHWGRRFGVTEPGELMRRWVEGVPVKRAGAAAEVAGLVAFLASAEADYITGQAINIDGGLIMS